MQPLDTNSVKEWRHRRMLSQQEVADRAGTSLFTIQRIERGEGNVRPKTGRAVAAALGVPIEELLPKAQAPLWSDEPRPERPAFDFTEARESIDTYCQRWEQVLAEDGLDDRGILEFAVTAVGWIPVLDVALSAEIHELKQATGLPASELLPRSEMAQANKRYLTLVSKIIGEPGSEYAPQLAEVINLEEIRERLADTTKRAVG